MNKDKSNIIFALIMTIMIILIIAVNFFHINYGSLPLVVLGIAFFYLYYSKNKTWALIISTILFIIYFFSIFNNILKSAHIWCKGLIFIVPGIILILKYYNIKNIIYAVAGSFILCIGIFIISVYFEEIKFTCASSFFAIIGSSFVLSYVISKSKTGIICLITTIIFMVISIFCLVGTNADIIYYIYPLSIMLLSFILIVLNITKNKLS